MAAVTALRPHSSGSTNETVTPASQIVPRMACESFGVDRRCIRNNSLGCVVAMSDLCPGTGRMAFSELNLSGSTLRLGTGPVTYAVREVVVDNAASAAVTKRNARAANLPVGSRSPRSHRASVQGSTPIRRADAFCVTQERKRWEFLLTTAPLSVPGATGSVLNPIAVF